MLEAAITKAVVVFDSKKKLPVIMGVAKYCDMQVNFAVPYDWDMLDTVWFCKELRDKLAHDFDVAIFQVDIKEKRLLAKMAEGWNVFKSQVPGRILL